jgi:DNA-binding FadR family transcriptional regulator
MITNNQFDLMKYLAERARDVNNNGANNRIPSLTKLGKEKGVSISYLREQLGVARTLGIVEVRPKTGINVLPYRFGPAVNASLEYAIRIDRNLFYKFADLRTKLEAEYWYSAIELLQADDLNKLKSIVKKAIKKVNLDRRTVPHKEHKELHLTIFSRLDNPFVTGFLEAFWESYKKISQSVVNDLDYLVQIWDYHNQIVNAICDGDFEKSYHVMLFHMDFLGRKDI